MGGQGCCAKAGPKMLLGSLVKTVSLHVFVGACVASISGGHKIAEKPQVATVGDHLCKFTH